MKTRETGEASETRGERQDRAGRWEARNDREDRRGMDEEKVGVRCQFFFQCSATARIYVENETDKVDKLIRWNLFANKKKAWAAALDHVDNRS